MKRLLSIFAAGGLVATPAAQAQDVAVFTPSGPWALDYGDDYCRLGRVFTNGSDQMELGIERIRPGPQIRIWAVGNALRFFRGSTETGYTFLPSQGERSVQPIRATQNGMQVLSLPEVTLAPFTPGAGPPPKYDPAAERAVAKGVTAIGLGKGLTRPLRFETGSLEQPISALQTCTDDLVKSWGVDADKHKTLSAEAIPQGFPWLPAGMIGFQDFAKFAGNNNVVRVIVDANGKPTACHIAWATLDKALNDKICQSVMEKATFTPAKDASGQAIASYFMMSPMFMMPGPGAGGARR